MSFIAKNPLSVVEATGSPPAPIAGTKGLFPKSDGWYSIDSNGVVKKLLDSDDKNNMSDNFIVNVSVGSNSTNIKADKTFEEIVTAINSKQNVFAILIGDLSEDMYIPMTTYDEDGGMITFGKNIGKTHYGLSLFRGGELWFYSKMEFAHNDLSNIDNETFKAKAEAAGVSGTVHSVNGKTGAVILKAEDIKAYTKDEVDSKLSSVYKYKGTIDYYFQLPTNAEVGDVYNIRYASGENYEEEPLLYPNYNIDEATIPPFSDNGLSGFYICMKCDSKPAFMNGETLHVGVYSPSYHSTMTYFEVPILDSCPYPATSCAYYEEGYGEGSYIYIFVVDSEAPFNGESNDGYDNKCAEIYDYIKNHPWHTDEKPALQFNYEIKYIFEEPFIVNAGDNVAWTGTEWDALGGTVDMSLYAQTDLSNVDNATFKAKAESAGVGGSGNIEEYEIDYSLIEFDTSEIVPWEPMRHLTLTDMATDSKYDLYVENGKLSMEVLE